jgi:uncharacterized protein (TIGR02448 family)
MAITGRIANGSLISTQNVANVKHLASDSSDTEPPLTTVYPKEFHMTRLRLLSAAALLAVAANASATSFIVTTDSIVGALKASSDATSDVTSSFRDDKIVLAARDDAASFVASQGDIRGVKLESALHHIRHQAPQLEATDAQLAQAILTL